MYIFLFFAVDQVPILVCASVGPSGVSFQREASKLCSSAFTWFTTRTVHVLSRLTEISAWSCWLCQLITVGSEFHCNCCDSGHFCWITRTSRSFLPFTKKFVIKGRVKVFFTTKFHCFYAGILGWPTVPECPGLSRNRGCVSRVPGRSNPGQLSVPE